ncbi:MAG: VOC family protein [Thalassobaculum sp.]|uniref:VOC family protein n=1 Tax=Thalassobaculum sp. TaxID=2022740 RepID=UPI0032EE28DB
MPRITPFLWFDGQAEEAVNFYVGIFPNSKVLEVTRCGDAGPGPKGSVLVTSFELDGQRFNALNGGPNFKFNEAVSFVIECADQAEVDWYWERLSDGGSTNACGWLKDRFGVSWQVTPVLMLELLNDPDPGRAERAMRSMMTMTKFDIAALQAAADG